MLGIGIEQRCVPVEFDGPLEMVGDSSTNQHSHPGRHSSKVTPSSPTTTTTRRTKVITRLSSCVSRIKTRVVTGGYRGIREAATTTANIHNNAAMSPSPAAQEAADLDLYWVLVKELLGHHDCHSSFVHVRLEGGSPSFTSASPTTVKKQVHFKNTEEIFTDTKSKLNVCDKVKSFIYSSPSLRVDGASSTTSLAPPSLLHTGRDADLTETPLNNLLLNDWDVIYHQDETSSSASGESEEKIDNNMKEGGGATILTTSTIPQPTSFSSHSTNNNNTNSSKSKTLSVGCCPLCLASGLGDSEVSSLCMSVFSTLLLLLDGPNYIASKLAKCQSRLEDVINNNNNTNDIINNTKKCEPKTADMWSDVHSWRLYDGAMDAKYRRDLANATSLNAVDLASVDGMLDLYEHVQRCVDVHAKAALRSAVWNGQIHTTADNMLLILDNESRRRDVGEVLAVGQLYGLLERNGVVCLPTSSTDKVVEEDGTTTIRLPSRVRLTTSDGGYYYCIDDVVSNYMSSCSSNSLEGKAVEFCERIFTESVSNSAAACTTILREQVKLLLLSEIQAHEALQYTNTTSAPTDDDAFFPGAGHNASSWSSSSSPVDQYIEAATLSERSEEQTLTSLQVLYEGAIMALDAVSARSEAASYELVASISRTYHNKAGSSVDATSSRLQQKQQLRPQSNHHVFIFSTMMLTSTTTTTSASGSAPPQWDTNRVPIRLAVARLKDKLQLPVVDGKVSMMNLLESTVAMGITIAATMCLITASSTTTIRTHRHQQHSHDEEVDDSMCATPSSPATSKGFQYTPFFSSSLTLLHFLVLKGYKASVQVLLQWCTLPSTTASAISSINHQSNDDDDKNHVHDDDDDNDQEVAHVPAIVLAIQALITTAYVGMSDKLLNQEDGAGRTPIGIALCAENTEIIILLISAGCCCCGGGGDAPNDVDSGDGIESPLQSPYVSLHKPFRCRDVSISNTPFTSPAYPHQLITPLEYMLNQIQLGQSALIKREMVLRDQRTQERCYGGGGGDSDDDGDEDDTWEERMVDELSPLASIHLTLYCSVAAHFLRYPPVVVLHGALPTYMLRYVQGFDFEENAYHRRNDDSVESVDNAQNHTDLRLMLPHMKHHPSVKACEIATEIFDHLEVETITIAAARKPKSSIVELASMYGNRHPEANNFLNTSPKKDIHSISISMKIAAADPFWRFVVVAPINGNTNTSRKDPFLCGVVGNVISARQYPSPIRLGLGLRILVSVATTAIIEALRHLHRNDLTTATPHLLHNVFGDQKRADLLKLSKDVTRSRVIISTASSQRSSSNPHPTSRLNDDDNHDDSELLFPLRGGGGTKSQSKEVGGEGGCTLLQTTWSSISHSVLLPTSPSSLEYDDGEGSVSVEELLFSYLIDAALAEAVDVAFTKSDEWNTIPQEEFDTAAGGQLSHLSSGRGFPSSQQEESVNGLTGNQGITSQSGTHQSSLNQSAAVRTPSGVSLIGGGVNRPIQTPRGGRGVINRGRGRGIGGSAVTKKKPLLASTTISDDDSSSDDAVLMMKGTPSKRMPPPGHVRGVKQTVKTVSKKVSVAPRRGAPPLPTSRTTPAAAGKKKPATNNNNNSTVASFRVDLSSDDDDSDNSDAIVVSPIRRVNPTPAMKADSIPGAPHQSASILLQKAPPAGTFNNVDEPCPPVAISAKTGDVLVWVQDVAELVAVPRPPTWCIRLLSQLLLLSNSNYTSPHYNDNKSNNEDLDTHGHRCEVLQLFFHPHFMGVVENAFHGGSNADDMDFSKLSEEGTGNEMLIHLSPFSRRRQLHNHVVDDVLGDLLSSGGDNNDEDQPHHKTSAIVMDASPPKTSEEARYRQQHLHDALLQQARIRADGDVSSLSNITADLLRKLRPGETTILTPQRSALNPISTNTDITATQEMAASPIYTKFTTADENSITAAADAFVVVTDCEIEETVTTSIIHHHPLEPDSYALDPTSDHNESMTTTVSKVHRHEPVVDPSDQVAIITSVLTSAREQYLRSLYFGVVCDPNEVCTLDASSSRTPQHPDAADLSTSNNAAHPSSYSDPQELLRGMKADLLTKNESKRKKNLVHGDSLDEGIDHPSSVSRHRSVWYGASCTMSRTLLEDDGHTTCSGYRTRHQHTFTMKNTRANNQTLGDGDDTTLCQIRDGVVIDGGHRKDWREQLRARRQQESEHVLQPGTLLYFKPITTTITDGVITGKTEAVDNNDVDTTRSLLLYDQLFMRATGENTTTTVSGDAVEGIVSKNGGGGTVRPTPLPSSSSTHKYGYTTFGAIEYVPPPTKTSATTSAQPFDRYNRPSTLLSVLTLQDEVVSGGSNSSEESTLHIPSNTETLSHTHRVIENKKTSTIFKNKPAATSQISEYPFPARREGQKAGIHIKDVNDDVILDYLVKDKGEGLRTDVFNLCCSAFGIDSL